VSANHWDPAPHERTYYRHALTGDLGWLVRRDGAEHILLDRPGQEIAKPFKPGEWTVEAEYRPLTRMQFAQVAFAADKALCLALGKHLLARREWLSMRDEDRIVFMQMGPRAGGGRQELFEAIMASLERYGGR